MNLFQIDNDRKTSPAYYVVLGIAGSGAFLAFTLFSYFFLPQWFSIPFTLIIFCCVSVIALVYQSKNRRFRYVNGVLVYGMLFSVLSVVGLYLDHLYSSIVALSEEERVQTAMLWMKVNGLYVVSFFVFGVFICLFFKIVARKLAASEMGGKVDIYGSGHVQSRQELIQNGLLEKRGSYLGKELSRGNLIYCDVKPRTIIAPPGRGKGTGVIIPNALVMKNSCVFLDVKGEIFTVVANHRSYGLCGKSRAQYYIDPFGFLKNEGVRAGHEGILPEDTYGFNVFDFICSPHEDKNQFFADILSVANSLVFHERQNVGGPEKHFTELLKQFVVAAISDRMHKHFDDPKNVPKLTLYQLLELLTQPEDGLRDYLAELQKSKRLHESQIASSISKIGKDEWGSFNSSATTQLGWIGDEPMFDVLNDTSIDVDDIIDGDADLYLIISPSNIKHYKKLVSVFIQTVMLRLEQRAPLETPKEHVVFILDELGQLGNMPVVDQQWNVRRQYGAYFWAVFQNKDQMKVYETPKTFESADVLQVFGAGDTETIEMIQKLAGKQTDMAERYQYSNSKSGGQKGNTSAGQNSGFSVGEVATDVLTVDQIRTLSDEEQFILIAGQHPIKAGKPKYYEMKEFDGTYDENIYYR